MKFIELSKKRKIQSHDEDEEDDENEESEDEKIAKKGSKPFKKSKKNQPKVRIEYEEEKPAQKQDKVYSQGEIDF